MKKTTENYDVFISYSEKDKLFARDLVELLRSKGLSVWYDNGELRFGDSILRQIENALEHSNYYLVILSPDYFSKQWTQFELGVAWARAGKNRILPIYMGPIKNTDIRKFSPIFADKSAINAENCSLEEIADKISDVISKSSKKD
jgi:predicted nucleotide-binding protein